MLQHFLLVTAPFTFGHGLFLIALLALAFPRFAPEETFHPATFKIGLMLVGEAMRDARLFALGAAVEAALHH